MMKSTVTRWLLPSLVSAALLVSPLAMAAPQDGSGGKRYNNQSEQMKDGNKHGYKHGEKNFDREEMREKMEARHNEMADRLKLNAEQRQVWDEIHQERQEEWKNRMQNKHEKMGKHGRNKNDK